MWCWDGGNWKQRFGSYLHARAWLAHIWTMSLIYTKLTDTHLVFHNYYTLPFFQILYAQICHLYWKFIWVMSQMMWMWRLSTFHITLLHKFIWNNCTDKCHVVVFQIIGLCRLGYLVESSQSNTCGGASVVGRMQHPLISGIFAENKFFLIFPIAGDK